MRIEHHPYLDVLVREDGCIYLPQSGSHPAHWTFGSNSRGYRYVTVNGVQYAVHRLVAQTFIQYPIPGGYEIDHINRVRDDNRLANLRMVTHKDNLRNTPPHDRVTEQGRTHFYEDYRQANRECGTRYYAENRDKVRKSQALYYAENRDKIRECHTRYYSENKEKVRERAARSYQAKRKTHRQVRFSDGLYRWIPHEEALELLKIPLKQRIFAK